MPLRFDLLAVLGPLDPIASVFQVVQEGGADEDDATSWMLNHVHGTERCLRDTGSSPPALGTLIHDLNRSGRSLITKFNC